MTDELAHSGGFVLRAPVLPLATLDVLAGTGRARAAWLDGDDLAGAVAQERHEIAATLEGMLDGVREAIFVASPDLDAELDGGLGDDRVLRSVASYLTRMAARATPFGLFAACGAGQVGGTTTFALPGRVVRRTRLDYGFLAKLVADLAADPQLRDGLTYRPNSSLYRAGDRLRMAEARVDERGVRYHRVALEEDEALAAALDTARDGATLGRVAQALADDEITVEEAREYAGELVEAQVLVADLGPVVTGADPVERLAAALTHVAPETAATLTDVRAELAELDRNGGTPERYREIADRLRKLDPELKLARLYQVDAAWPGDALRLGDAVVAEVHRGVKLLHRFDSAPADDDLKTFREAFTDRYEGREVPLAEALDEEVGVGFGAPPGLAARGAPLLDGLPVPGTPGGGPRWTRADERRLQLVQRGTPAVELTKDDVEALAGADPRPLPDSVAAFGTLLAESPEALAAGDFRLQLATVGGPPGARLLGRFCDVAPELGDVVRRHVEDEAAVRPDAVLAEVVHLPEGRIGNILARPVLRAYEIPFLGTSGAPAEAQLAVDDLLVSVERNRVVLRSRRLGREVVPRLTTAHAVRPDALAVYRFLATLQFQGVAPALGWSWGALDSAPFLPRVTSGRLVLSRARWRLDRDALQPVLDARDPARRFAAVQELRAARDLPRRVAVAMADNELPVDLDSVVGCELLAHEARRGFGLGLVEWLAEPDRLCATSPAGAHVHEFVLPLVRRTPTPAAAPRQRATVERDFPPGSEWLSAKLYGGVATADLVLREVVAPLVAEVPADRWFFIRYNDPDPHLRLRFHGAPAGTLQRLHERAAPLLADGRLWRLQLDTYRREVERYGGDAGIEVAEEVFRADSDAVLAVLDVAAGDEGLDLRWRLALRGFDSLLTAVGLDLATRAAVVRSARDGFAAEQGDLGASARRHAGRVWRRERTALDALLSGSEVPEPLATGRARLEAHHAKLRGVTTTPEVAASFLHMHANRMLRAAQRTQEVVLYDLLARWYAAREARR